MSFKRVVHEKKWYVEGLPRKGGLEQFTDLRGGAEGGGRGLGKKDGVELWRCELILQCIQCLCVFILLFCDKLDCTFLLSFVVNIAVAWTCLPFLQFIMKLITFFSHASSMWCDSYLFMFLQRCYFFGKPVSCMSHCYP